MEFAQLDQASTSQAVSQLKRQLERQIIGQDMLLERLLVALLADGHLLVEGAPGLAKTKSIKTLAAGVEGSFHRIQFTPDLLPADLIGTEIYRPETTSFEFQQGPIFHHVILADEINRAPAKVQSALLEAMAERQVSVGRVTYQLPKLFLVMATQNPIEQEGTYPLPEAQLDRFLLYVRIQYPKAPAEQAIMNLALNEALGQQASLGDEAAIQISQETIFSARQEVLQLHMSPALEKYLVQLVIASREPKLYGDDLQRWIHYGISPRGTIALARCARALAWLHGRDYVSPEDIHAIAHDVLRHRILLTFTAEAEGIDTDHVISELLCRVAIP